MAEERRPPMRVLLGGMAPSLVRGGCDLLAADSAFSVVGVAADAGATITQAETLVPDVIMIDMHISQLGGFETTRRLRAVAPRSEVLLLGDDGTQLYHVAARVAGAGAYLLWQSAGKTLLPTLRALLGVSAPVPGRFQTAGMERTTSTRNPQAAPR